MAKFKDLPVEILTSIASYPRDAGGETKPSIGANVDSESSFDDYEESESPFNDDVNLNSSVANFTLVNRHTSGAVKVAPYRHIKFSLGYCGRFDAVVGCGCLLDLCRTLIERPALRLKAHSLTIATDDRDIDFYDDREITASRCGTIGLIHRFLMETFVEADIRPELIAKWVSRINISRESRRSALDAAFT